MKSIRTVFACLFIAFVSLAMIGCRSASEIEHHTEKEIIYVDRVDTVKEIVHDTTMVSRIVTDTIDKYVRDSSWVDSLGRQYHDRYEREYRGTKEAINELRAVREENVMLRNEVSRLQHEVESRSEETIVEEKKVYVWWPMLVFAAAALGFWIYRRLAK